MLTEQTDCFSLLGWSRLVLPSFIYTKPSITDITGVFVRGELSLSDLVYCRVAYRPRIRMGVITKFLQDKDSFHCIALFNVIQLYENLKWTKTNKRKEHTVSNLITFVGKKKTMIEMTNWTVSKTVKLGETKTRHIISKLCKSYQNSKGLQREEVSMLRS